MVTPRTRVAARIYLRLTAEHPCLPVAAAQGFTTAALHLRRRVTSSVVPAQVARCTAIMWCGSRMLNKKWSSSSSAPTKGPLRVNRCC